MSRMMNITRALSVGTVLLAMGTAGCTKVVTPENFAKIRPGQSEADVENVLGKPTASETQSGEMGTALRETWEDGNKSIIVFLVGGKVLDGVKMGF